MDCNTSQETLAPLLPAATSAQVETFSEAALKRIKDRRDAEIRTGERNYNEIAAYMEESFISHYTKHEDQAILIRWKRELSELLHLPLPYDPMYNFQWSNSNVVRDSLHKLRRRLRDHKWPAASFSQSGSLSADKVYKSMSRKFDTPEDARYLQIANILSSFTDGTTVLDHYEKSDYKRVRKIVGDIDKYLYKSNWYLKHPYNWARIWEEFVQLKQGNRRLIDCNGRSCTICKPEEFVKSLHLIPNPNPSALRRFTTFAPGSDHFESLQHHHRVTGRYALISGVRTYGSAEWGGQSLVPL